MQQSSSFEAGKLAEGAVPTLPWEGRGGETRPASNHN